MYFLRNILIYTALAFVLFLLYEGVRRMRKK